MEFSELREYTHGFFSNVAEILDDAFIQVQKALVLGCLKTCVLSVMVYIYMPIIFWQTVPSSCGTPGIFVLQS